MKPYPPLGLLYLSAFLKRKGFRIRVFDSTFQKKPAFDAFLRESRPPVVGLYANMMTRASVLQMIRSARDIRARVVVGGPDPANYPQEYLDHGADVVVFGEGELTLSELIPELLHGRRELHRVAGIAFKDEHGRMVVTPARRLLSDLDGLPLPDREAICLQQYMDTWRRHHGMSSISLITARGCPYSCTWCSHAVFGKTLRKRSPEKVVEEIAAIQEQYHPDVLWYADDVFNIQPRWLYRLAGALKARNLHIPFECICRADRMDEDLIRLLRHMGCFRMWIGSESGSQRLLDRMKRGVTVEQIQSITRLAKKHGIETGMFIMWGYEDETDEDILATIEHVKKALPDIVLTTVSYPIKGTEYYQRVEARGLIVRSRPWMESSDRDLGIRGRPGASFYTAVNRRLYGELALAKMKEQGNGSLTSRARAKLKIWAGAAGMRLHRLYHLKAQHP